MLNIIIKVTRNYHQYFLSSIPIKIDSLVFDLKFNKPKGLKVAKEVLMADRLDGRCAQWSLGSMVDRLNGR